jgi:hypothetical protein
VAASARTVAGACAALLAALALGCESGRTALERSAFRLNPFGTTEVAVVERSAHGPYFFVRVSGSALDLRFAVPRSEACASVLRAEALVRYEKSGSFGRFARDGETCDAVGTLSPAQWRDRQPRPGGRVDSFGPRSSARFLAVYADEEYVFLRGRFALAARAGIPSSFDCIAIVPADAACREVATRRDASLEFRQVGSEAFRLLVGRSPCVVAGFAVPVDGLAPGPAPEE